MCEFDESYTNVKLGLFVNLGKRYNFFLVNKDVSILVPFNGQTPEQDYKMPFIGHALGVFVGYANRGGGDPLEVNYKFCFCESPSNRPFAKCVAVGKGDRGPRPLVMPLFQFKLPSRIKLYVNVPIKCGIMETSSTPPALYFFKL